MMYTRQTDYGSNLYAANISQMATENSNFRTAIWTGNCLQMTLMCIPSREEIGMERHEETDQLIRVEQGRAVVKVGRCQCQQEFQRNLREGDVVFIPAGTWHNIINTGSCTLKLSSVYAPPNHPRGTIHRTREEAEREEH